jgi:hypothetical protein
LHKQTIDELKLIKINDDQVIYMNIEDHRIVGDFTCYNCYMDINFMTINLLSDKETKRCYPCIIQF